MKVGEGVWELFAEDGEMRMYKREEEVDGLVVDPLKALHSVRGNASNFKSVFLIETSVFIFRRNCARTL